MLKKYVACLKPSLKTSFQTRKIIAAVHQHINFYEFLPILLGDAAMSKYNLWVKEKGFEDMYDPTINPGIANSFSTAAFR